MEHPTTLKRVRARQVPDPMNPRRTIEDWDKPDELPLPGFLDSESSSEASNATRAELVSTATLYLDDTAADVRRGDLITDGTHKWRVQGYPTAPMNPFTGWRPYLEIKLEEVTG